MAIKAITFQGEQNFKSSLFALTMTSMFKNTNKANGYFSGYGNNINASAVGTSAINISTGAFLVQGRMVEVVSTEVVSVPSFVNGNFGYVIARIETLPSNNINCTLRVSTASSLSSIPLTQSTDINSSASETQNKIYDLPIYSFIMSNNQIVSLTKTIPPLNATTMADLQNELLSKIYPVGSIYMSMNSTSPASFIGGTWTRIAKGRVLVGQNTSDAIFSTAGATGGNKTATLPKHNHLTMTGAEFGSHGAEFDLSATSDMHTYTFKHITSNDTNLQTQRWMFIQSKLTSDSQWEFDPFMTSYAGEENASNLQPYEVCYIWKRIS